MCCWLLPSPVLTWAVMAWAPKFTELIVAPPVVTIETTKARLSPTPTVWLQLTDGFWPPKGPDTASSKGEQPPGVVVKVAVGVRVTVGLTVGVPMQFKSTMYC